ncbi:GNAT family N-acetyltransferase [Anaeromyxobacter paludicola]|uniref:GNAT family N-acetyltransferase n=1 Tax=Anaeromyxobacter paludicola TaxID=2918171 RepID=A0ABM7XA55_9BACT|nr:GNAT family N-acetyltransferase [Anaeromyxobacter paludicola]BDG08705.1 hypothetical protein AMPC_18180 [Anaeromyxobacter paludicola]
MSFDLRILEAISDVPAASWDALLAHEPDRATPFLRHAFLSACELSGCAAGAGFAPRHLTLWRGRRLVAAAPAYVKDGSEGDFSRDWEWAAAARQARVRFYPKLVLTVPFTPATGRRFLVARGVDRAAAVAALVAGARALAEEERLGAVQVLFPLEEEAGALAPLGLAARLDFQYHWANRGYRAYDDFLARFSSKRRNQLRRERAAPGREGIEIATLRGPRLAEDAAALARDVEDLHRATVDQMAWGMRWVDRDFFERLLTGMPDAIEIVEARRGGRRIAAAFNVASRTHLYGRYWGCREEHPFLHFNVCLYHSVEECIRRGVQVFEGGAGGEHKLARGFEPAETWSSHLYLDARLDGAVRRHLEQEVPARREALLRWQADAPVLRHAGAAD